jgi:hypothetical protein
VARFAPPRHILISVDEVEGRTGRPVPEILDETGVQSLVRISPSGKREQMLRVPVTLLLDDGSSPEQSEQPHSAAATGR